MPSHKHDCQRCEHRWSCLAEKCQIAKAAKVNKTGPLCSLCMHLIMAKRFAAERSVSAAGFIALVGELTDVE